MATPEGIVFVVREVPNAFRDRTRLRTWLRAVARHHGRRIHGLTFVLMSDPALLRFNQHYLGHDTFTDIITFDLCEGEDVAGDVLLSLDRIRENAAAFGVPLQQELRRVMVHGLLHLLGYADKSKKDKAAIRELEDQHLRRYK